MQERKKIVILAILLAILAGILMWQWSNRERPVPAVKDETEHRALATLIEMLEVGRVRGWAGTAEFWESLPDRRMQMHYQHLMGSHFRSEFTFQGSSPVPDDPAKLLLYGIFEAGVPVEVLLTWRDSEFKIVSINEM